MEDYMSKDWRGAWILARFVCLLVCRLALFCFQSLYPWHVRPVNRTHCMAAANGGKVVAEED